ncbi:MAG: glycosyltransferase [Desulfobulbaceae bacterium]|jgi:rhamnosyltransferase|nr:glycosyltransferase [Desulfobulbaceae bacterium]MDY0350840.1 glycosyltransferase [Desulfobulbaceae bacterium]
MNTTSISIIIPTLNGGRRFGSLLASLRAQTVVPEELLVVDSGSDDGTPDLAGQYGATVLTVPPREFDHGGTRTMAARRASGDFLLFMTQDAVPVDSHALENLMEPFGDPRVAAVYGRQLPFPDATCFARHLRLFNYPEKPACRCWEDRHRFGFRTAFISNSFAAYRKETLAAVGFFEEGLLFGEDTFTVAKLLRSGYCVFYAATAKVWHSHNYSTWQEFRRYFDIGVVHARHRELLRDFGTPAGEGRNYVFSELSFLMREKNFLRLPAGLWRNSMKFLAYNLGKRYTALPPRLAALCSMNRRWWSGPAGKGA